MTDCTALYSDESILILAYIQAAWQMGYEMVVDYFRSHPEAVHAAGFADGRIISIGQYWERRQALGIWTFWLFFVGMVWQLIQARTRKQFCCGLALLRV